jgi:sugar phosphate isomerase/epimerase
MAKLGVSLYSYQLEYFRGIMTLEDCLAHAASIGACGIEMVPEQTMTDFQYETIDEEFVAKWKDWMAKYDLVSTNMNLYDDFDVYPNRIQTMDERFARFKHGVLLAKALGFRSVRGSSEMPVPLLERCLKVAEYYGIIVSVEIHSPFSLKSTYVQDWLNLIDRTGSKFAGIHPDCGTFSKGPNLGRTEQALRQGAKKEIIDFLQQEYTKVFIQRQKENKILDLGDYRVVVCHGMAEAFEKARKMGGSNLEISLFTRLNYDDPRWLIEYMPYIKHLHAKFYNMVDNGKGMFHDPAIDLEGAMQALKDGGYQYWISSEYEGAGAYRDLECPIEPPDSRDLVEKEQKLMSSILFA